MSFSTELTGSEGVRNNILNQPNVIFILCTYVATCHKKVDPGSCSDHENEIYCRPCYGRKFGPKGYGYAGGSGAGLSMDFGAKDGSTPE